MPQVQKILFSNWEERGYSPITHPPLTGLSLSVGIYVCFMSWHTQSPSLNINSIYLFLKELNCFIENALSIPGRYRFVVMISRKGKHVPNDQILSMITSSVESLRSGIASFPIALIYLSWAWICRELLALLSADARGERCPKRPLAKSIYVKAPHPTAIDCHKQWLYHHPNANASNAVTSNGGIALRVLHLRCFKLMNDNENIFWLLSASISSVRNVSL